MLRFLSTLGALLLLAAAAQAGEIGFRRIVIDADGPRPLNVSLWYPTRDTTPSGPVGENRVFVGVPAVTDAAPDHRSHPLVVLSHGYGGSWRNLNWLAGELVAEGYAVAAPDHPGTTTFDRDPTRAATLWERPRDLSRTIDAVLRDPALAGRIDPDRIAAIGHSLGGWTVAALAGARFDPMLFARDCEDHPSPRTCGLSDELGLTDPAIGRDMRDPRIKVFVTLDLGLARGFTPDSLAGVRLPALVFGAGVDIGDLPAALESGWLAEHLPPETARLVMIPDAMHFSFMQLCKPGAAALIEAEDPGDGIVCHDGGGRGRAAIHGEIAGTIIRFLTQSLPPR
ncbi:putative dienelactone hydrolase [Pseudochelatococcus lubricantis]|uniref:Dienelactone hydrolase n=1 Tax=Pseudochelatococcus lubricantis TaxID=1538102 RepID=A0ABX0UYT9_9HYPH|nr:alpha/beta fold hydrolase [Pseudochelatococcus lubricantis]NIJ57553.1 putative dienelactone hydrolase [Pseudochelatococcus lubricantis]